MSATTTPASNPRFTAKRVLKIIAVTLATAIAGSLTAIIITATVQAISHTPPAPAACHNPDLPSGDEQRLGNGTVLVCTDGVWHRP